MATYMRCQGPTRTRLPGGLRATDAGAVQPSALAAMLTFVSAPDYENAGGRRHGQHLHGHGETPTDGTYMAMRAVAVMVTNVDEVETVTLSATQPQIGTEITAEPDRRR